MYEKADTFKIWEGINECKIMGYSSCEVTAIKGDGTKFPVIGKFSSLKDKEGNITHIICTATDVTKLREREEKLKNSSAFLDSVIESMPIGLCLRKADDPKWYRVNPAAEKLVGYSMEEMLGKDVLQQPFNTDEATNIILKKRKKYGAGASMEVPWIKKSGEKIIVRAAQSPIKDASGKVTDYMFMANDVTELRKRERKT
jgi:PAS domain S-box-containing protein